MALGADPNSISLDSDSLLRSGVTRPHTDGVDNALECAPAGGQIGRMPLTSYLGFRRIEAMVDIAPSASSSGRQVVQDHLAGETPHGLRQVA
jgi:hypothetical protein